MKIVYTFYKRENEEKIDDVDIGYYPENPIPNVGDTIKLDGYTYRVSEREFNYDTDVITIGLNKY